MFSKTIIKILDYLLDAMYYELCGIIKQTVGGLSLIGPAFW